MGASGRACAAGIEPIMFVHAFQFSVRFPSRVALAAALSLAPMAPTLAFAGEGENYVIPATDGYGISECLHGQSDCGRVMADSWCEAHGHAHALAYGTGDDVTGSTGSSSAIQKIAANDVVIRCGD